MVVSDSISFPIASQSIYAVSVYQITERRVRAKLPLIFSQRDALGVDSVKFCLRFSLI